MFVDLDARRSRRRLELQDREGSQGIWRSARHLGAIAGQKLATSKDQAGCPHGEVYRHVPEAGLFSGRHRLHLAPGRGAGRSRAAEICHGLFPMRREKHLDAYAVGGCNAASRTWPLCCARSVAYVARRSADVAAGKLMRAQRPRGCRSSNVSVPPWVSAIARTMASPRPKPPVTCRAGSIR